MTKSMDYQKGQKLRSHDFPGLELKAYYIEGEITEVDQEFIYLHCTRDNVANPKNNRAGQDMVIPIRDLLDTFWEYPRLKIIS